jgi:hypothetical protein
VKKNGKAKPSPEQEYMRIVTIIERNGRRYLTSEEKCLKVSIYRRGKLTHQDDLREADR